MGSRLIPMLSGRGHAVTALARPGSESRVSAEATMASGNALDAASLRACLRECDTWVQLIGTPHPAPWKAEQFRAVDLRAVAASAEALRDSAIRHFIYLSVTQPSPFMRSYVQVRAEGEALLSATGVPATFLRPWYVLGPGHRWPYALIPAYRILESIPATREGALRFGLVTLGQMLAALVQAVENPPDSVRILDVPAIRNARI